MGHHRNNENAHIRLETFLDYANEADLLSAILAWWEDIEDKYAHTNMESIVITWDDDGCGADVVFTYVTEEILKRLDEEIQKQRPLTVSEEQIQSQQN